MTGPGGGMTTDIWLALLALVVLLQAAYMWDLRRRVDSQETKLQWLANHFFRGRSASRGEVTINNAGSPEETRE